MFKQLVNAKFSIQIMRKDDLYYPRYDPGLLPAPDPRVSVQYRSHQRRSGPGVPALYTEHSSTLAVH